jgi:glycosyltransferase involved in cell wall biosynthesis
VQIGFNAQLLSYRHWYRSAGISRYIDRTLAGLPSHLRNDSCVAFVGPDVSFDSPSLAAMRVERSPLPMHRPMVRILWEQLVLPIACRRWRIDVLHAPAYVAPLLRTGRSVVTFHDLSFFRLPEAFNRPNRTYLQEFSRLSARRADRFIAVSESTRRDLIQLLAVGPDKVDVVHNGVEERFQPIGDAATVEEFRRARGLPDRFVLYLGTLEPRKNVVTLIRAYAQARKRGITETLVLAGGRGWGSSPEAHLIERLGLEAHVRSVGFVPMEDQVLWYNAATLFAYPSLYEGFGFPALEAMACGTPVVAGNCSSLPEVVGDAGLLVNPRDADDLAEAIVRVLRDDQLRFDLACRGRERARRFSWEAAARGTVGSYRRAFAPRLDETNTERNHV